MRLPGASLLAAAIEAAREELVLRRRIGSMLLLVVRLRPALPLVAAAATTPMP
jgi:hypothetical protein